MILRELFDKPNEFETMAETYEVAAYKFTTQDGREFVVEFEEDNDENWEFIFKDETGSMQKTGKGSAVEIFSTVGAIAKRFMTKYKPTEPVYFQAANAEPSRVKLYDRMTKTIVREFPAYKVIRDVEANYTSYYVLPKDSDALDYLENIEENENLNELLDKPLPFKLKSDDDDWVQYNFVTSDKRKFHVMFDNFYGNWTVEFADNEMSKAKTGKGGAVEIFATVAAIMRDFMKRHKDEVSSMTFRAEGDSRIKLYTRFAQVAAREFPQYKLTKNPSRGGVDFTLKLPKDKIKNENLTELLDQPLDFELTDDDPGFIRYSFTTSDDRQFEVAFDESLGLTWDIVFVDDEENTQKTGKGGSVEIFATVKAIVKDFIKRQGSDLEGLRFNAQGGEDSRVRLYDRFAKMIAQEYPQWKIKSQAFHGGKEWILRKPRPGYSFDNPEDEIPASGEKESINELFNQPLKYNKVVPRASDSGRKLMWRFDTPKGNRIQVEAYKSEFYDKWEFGFYDFEDDNPHITGKGDAAQVFATVIAIGEEFVREVKPNMVEWFADNDEPSRVSLYDRMVKTLARRMPDYEVKSQDTGGSFQRYVMIRKDAEKESIGESVDRELEEFVSKGQLNDVERFAEKLFKKYNIDVDFTRHFFDRVNDERNVKVGGSEITVPELQKIFKKEQRRWGKQIAALPDSEEGVMKDTETNINIPFVKKDTPEPQPDKLITKTAMKKPNFKSNTPFYTVETKKRLTLRSLFEAPGKTAAFAFGRLNPATNGHELLVNEIVAQDADAFLFLSDRPPKMPKDPLAPEDKQAWAQASFPQIKVELAQTALAAADKLFEMGYTNLIYLEGEPKMGKVIQKYNGVETAKHNYNFDNIDLVQLSRDPDAEGPQGMSATKLRQTVIDDNFEAFTQGITKPAQGKAKEMFSKLQAALSTTESAAGPPDGSYKSSGMSAAGPSDGSYEKSKEEAPVKWQRGLWEHIFTSQQSGFPYIKQESRTAWIPLVSSTLRILQKEEKRTMYGAHVMGIKDIPKLMKLQGKKGKQVSAFTTDEYGDLEGGVWTEGGIIAILKGTAMSSGQGDIMSKVDKQGRRVVDFGPQSPAMNIIGKYADSKAYLTAIKPIYEARARISKELEDKFGPETYKVDPKAKHESIKEYMDVVNATLQEHTKVFKKIIFEWAESQNKNWKDTKESEYDEIVMGNFKIIKLFVKPSSRDQNQQTYQFRDFFEKNEFPFPIEYVRDTSTQHLKRYLDQNEVEESIDELGETMRVRNVTEKLNNVDEEAKSKAQQRFMGMVHAAQKGKKAASPEVAKVAKNMKKKDAKDFASTKHKGKPEHVKSSIYEYDDDFDDDGNRIPIGADEAPKWTRSLFDHLFMKKGTKYDGPDRPFRKGDKEVFIPLVPAMIDKLVGGPTELYGAHSTGTQNLDRLIKMQGKKGKQISVFTTDREGQLSDGVWGGGGVVAILRGNAYAASSGDIMSVVDKQGRRVLDIGPSGDLMNIEDNEDLLYGDEYPNMYKAIRSLQRSITAKIEDIIDEHGDVEGKEKAAFIKEYIDGLYSVIPKYRKTFSKLMVGWAQSQNKNWQEVHGTYDEVVMGNYKIVHIFLVGKDHQQVSKLESFMQEKAMGYIRKNGRYIEDDSVKDPFIAKLYKEGKLKLIDKTEEDFPYQVLDTYMKRNKEMGESLEYARNYSLGKLLETASAGSSSAGNIATVVNPSKKKKSKTHNPDGTIKNALDSDDNLMNGTLVRR